MTNNRKIHLDPSELKDSNIRKIHIAQLNTLRRLTGRKEVKRFRGSNRKLAALVRKEYKAADSRTWLRAVERMGL